jgi:proline iminopeptidase
MKSTTKGLRDLFPKTKPYRSGYLQVSKLHTIHFEECGNPRGKPLVFLHGGPGGGIEPFYHRYFDPKKWRIVLHDQRGCGKSTPFSELRENTTWHLVADIETLREHLGIDRWVVFGGSWGSTLSLAYAETHPDRCKALVLRGIFLLRRSELLWFYQEGASAIFPDAWEHEPQPPRAPEGRARLVDLGGEHEQTVLRPGAREEVRSRPVRRRLRPHRGSLLREPRFHEAR